MDGRKRPATPPTGVARGFTRRQRMGDDPNTRSTDPTSGQLGYRVRGTDEYAIPNPDADPNARPRVIGRDSMPDVNARQLAGDRRVTTETDEQQNGEQIVRTSMRYHTFAGDTLDVSNMQFERFRPGNSHVSRGFTRDEDAVEMVQGPVFEGEAPLTNKLNEAGRSRALQAEGADLIVDDNALLRQLTTTRQERAVADAWRDAHYKSHAATAFTQFKQVGWKEVDGAFRPFDINPGESMLEAEARKFGPRDTDPGGGGGGGVF